MSAITVTKAVFAVAELNGTNSVPDPSRFDTDSDPGIRTTEITGADPAHFLSAFSRCQQKDSLNLPSFFAFFITDRVHCTLLRSHKTI